MKQWIYKAALAVAMVGASGASMAADDGQFFVNGEVGSKTHHLSRNAHGEKNGWGGGLRLGYLWNVENVSFGLEGGYVNLGKVKASETVPAIGPRAVGPAPTTKIGYKGSMKGIVLGGNLKYHFGDNWFASARGGLFRATTNDSISQDGATLISIKETANKFYAGVGAGYDFNEHFGLAANFDYFRAGSGDHAKLYGVSAEYRF
ncbi:outer membrane beta-barrel protein [Dyella sp. LX-66]|uniref:outer membrane protein n=1 Tax=unclassified Dyella TaxID=2634549 RepID=UPI001BE03064|nr:MULTISPECIES: outer membrane beta-barrel protein [unclassified Dyella]MBT2116127.1 outer membrane beta-barrel protein [Dyella sp. LX-1]MBT2138137.1 outer membrane beta-barrel protein [Dyella sp. LX-66]